MGGSASLLFSHCSIVVSALCLILRLFIVLSCFRHFVGVCARALDINERLIMADQHDYHQNLTECFYIMAEELSSILHEQVRKLVLKTFLAVIRGQPLGDRTYIAKPQNPGSQDLSVITCKLTQARRDRSHLSKAQRSRFFWGWCKCCKMKEHFSFLHFFYLHQRRLNHRMCFCPPDWVRRWKTYQATSCQKQWISTGHSAAKRYCAES